MFVQYFVGLFKFFIMLMIFLALFYDFEIPVAPTKINSWSPYWMPTFHDDNYLFKLPKI